MSITVNVQLLEGSVIEIDGVQHVVTEIGEYVTLLGIDGSIRKSSLNVFENAYMVYVPVRPEPVYYDIKAKTWRFEHQQQYFAPLRRGIFVLYLFYGIIVRGRVAEWFMALVLKTRE